MSRATATQLMVGSAIAVMGANASQGWGNKPTERSRS